MKTKSLFYISILLVLVSCSTTRKNCIIYPFVKSGLWGYIDANCKEIIEPKYIYAYEFRNGLAAVQEDSLFGFINIKGKMYIEPMYKYINYKKTQILASLPNNEFDTKPIFSTEEDIINLEFNERERILFNSKHNIKLKLDRKYYLWESLSDSLIRVSERTNIFIQCYIDIKGNEIIRIENVYGDDFHEGLAAVQYGDQRPLKFGFIDKKGNLAIPAIYDEIIKGFCNGIACVVKDNYWGYINKKGNWIWKHEFEGDLIGIRAIFGQGYHCDCSN